MRILNGKLKDLFFGLSYGVAILFALAIILYIIETNFGVDGEPVGFELATISAVIGGFILASAGITSYASQQNRMKRIGLFYLVATIAFVIFGIGFPIIEEHSFIPIVTGVGMAAGSMSFAIGTLLLALTVPRIWSDSE